MADGALIVDAAPRRAAQQHSALDRERPSIKHAA
jgi:hypothetical protein